jgi:capsular exopolysaccharide synthesis family protein
MGAVLGLIAAGGLSYIREISDKSYHSAEQIAEHLCAPVIGHIPMIKPDRNAAKQIDSALDPCLCAFYSSKASASEAYKSIRTALYFSNQADGQKILQVTSPTPADGKSTVAANIAIAVAQSGKSVLLLDADLRRPRIDKLFGIEVERGLSWLLSEAATSESDEKIPELLGEVIHESEVPNLSILGAGKSPDNPSELLSSTHFDRLLDAVRDKFDFILLDSPPLLAVTDPSNVAARVDGVLMVVRLRKNVKPLAAQATRMIETLESNLIGIVVNGVGSRQARGYGKYGAYEGYRNRGRYYMYGYGYTYGSDGRYADYYNDDKEKNSNSRANA